MKKHYFFLLISLIAALLTWRSFVCNSYHFTIPIEKFSDSEIPCTSIKIEDYSYPVEIDLGSKTAISLDKIAIDKVKKNPAGSSRRMDFRGNKYETPLYTIDFLKIGELILGRTKIREESSVFALEGSILYKGKEKADSNPIVGRIGRDIFDSKNLLIDVPNLQLIVCDSLKKTSLEDPISLPFENTLAGIVLKIKTDAGTYRFLLDTGCTASALRSHASIESTKLRNGIPVFESSKFVIADVDFGKQDFYLLDLSLDFNEMDGLLGMDFIKDHAVYLDFRTNTAYISRPEM
jgi:hypothetical protein